MTELQSGTFMFLAKKEGESGCLVFQLNHNEHIIIYLMNDLNDCMNTVFDPDLTKCMLYQDIMALYPGTNTKNICDYMGHCLSSFGEAMILKQHMI